MKNWLGHARELKGFTKRKLAEVVGIESSNIGKYEAGKRRPSPEVTKKIAAVLGFDWTRFFEDPDSSS